MFSIGARSPYNPTPGNGHIWFSPIIPRTGEAILEANKVFSQAAKDFGLPILSFSLPTTYWTRAFIFLFGFPITHDVATNKKNRESFKNIVQHRRRTRLGRVPHRARVSGRRDEYLLVQQPRAAALP